MPKIVLKVPAVSGTNSFSQKGPTCWYYSSKMLLRFHDMLLDKNSDLYKQFKAMHELRKVLTDTESRKQRDNPEFLKGKLLETKKQLKKSKTAIQERLGQLGQQLIESRQKNDHVTEQKLKTLIDKISSSTKQVQAKRRQRIQGIESAVSVLEGKFKNGMVRSEIFKEFFEDWAFNVEQVKTDDDGASLYSALKYYGPLYTSGELSISKNGRTDLVNTLGSNNTESMQSVSTLTVDSAHAVVIAGVDTDTKLIYYKDPNFSNLLLQVDFDTFMGKARKDDEGNVRVIRAICPELLSSPYECPHVADNSPKFIVVT